MGSGLILLVIVGAWLAVLVPMALRSHDASSSLSSVERFSDAMRVLARREASVRRQARSIVLPARPATTDGSLPLDRAALAARRLRVLLVLLALTLISLVGALAVSGWCAVPTLAFAAATSAYVAYLRKLELRRQERRSVPAVRRRTAPQRIVGIPDRMPARVPVPQRSAGQAPARYEERPGTDTWTSPAFPVPTYVNAPVAPARVVDLTRPGAWTADAGTDRSLVGADDELDTALNQELDDILDRRRASGDW